MADPVTTNKALTIPATGSDPNAWGPIVNENFSLIDAFLGTTTALTLSSGTVTLNASQVQAVRLALSGMLSGAVTIIVPQKAGYFYFHDLTTRGGYAITVSTGASGGRTQNLPAKMCHIYTDGTNVWRVNEPDHGETKDFAGPTLPPLWLWADGSAVSRSTYADLFSAIGFATTGTVTSGSTSITGVAALPVGLVAPLSIPIEGAGIPTGTTVTDFSGSAGNYTLTISQAATATTAGTALTLLPHGQGDGSTTFNVPDMRGRAAYGADALGGTAASRLTTASLGVTAVIGRSGGNELLQSHNHNLTDNGHNHTQNSHNHSLNNPAHTHTGGDSGHGHSDAGHNHPYTTYDQGHVSNGGGYPPGASSGGFTTGTGFANIQTGYANIYINAATTSISANAATATNNPAQTGISINDAGTGASQNLAPAIVMNKIIYAGQ
ncbi:MAG TPA: phage tail protein [Acidiphilium sp.]|nr:phage tail protein [Acidiphilium sp.]